MNYLKGLFYIVISLLIFLPIVLDLAIYGLIFLIGYKENFKDAWVTSNFDFDYAAFISLYSTVSAFILKGFRHVLDLYRLGQIINYYVSILGWLWMLIAFGAAYYLIDESMAPGIINLMNSNNQFALYLLYHSFTGYLLVSAARGKN